MKAFSLFALVALAAAVAFVSPARAEDKKDDIYKIPSLEDKGWKKQESGLKIWDVKEGKGDEVKPGATVKVHYTGWLTNGKVFDSSRKRDEPISFGLNQVIKGWTEGCVGMKVGGTRRLLIPAELGYGKKGAGDDIPPDSTLVFEIELLEVKNK
jgi:FKBP-type peptidyl-prolyl cis-trans isomerase